MHLRSGSGLKLGFQYLVPFLIVAAAVLLLVFRPFAAAILDGSFTTTLLIVVTVLFLVHSALALRLHQITAFFAGLELVYADLLLLRSGSAALAGAPQPVYAWLLALLLPYTLLIVYLFGQRPLSRPASMLRAALILGLPPALAWASDLAPRLAAVLLEPPSLPLSRAPLPASGIAGLVLLAAVLALRGRRRTIYELCLLLALAPAYTLFALIGRIPTDRSGGAGEPVDAGAGSAALPGGWIVITFAGAFLILLYGLYRLYWQRAYLDELTGLANRRAFDERLRFLRRHDTLAMIDIDHFKKINDTYGHAEGDNALRSVAGQIRRAYGGQAFRYGGEEFALILPGVGREAAVESLELLRRTVSERRLVVRAATERRKSRRQRGDRRRRPAGAARSARSTTIGRRIRITVSVGFAACNRRGKPAEMLRRADQALYEAKSRGRNRVVGYN